MQSAFWPEDGLKIKRKKKRKEKEKITKCL